MPDPVKSYAELQIILDRVRPDAHQVELRFLNPLSEAEQNPVKGDARFDAAALLQLERQPKDYGCALASMLFADANVRAMFQQVKSSVETINLPLRVRLSIGTAAPELHSFRWELLTGPDGEAHLFTSERVLFSRFMTNQDWRTVRLRPRSDATALVAVSAPSNLADFGLADVDLDGEIGRATGQLGGIGVAVLGKEEPLTLMRLIDRLREPVDILYLVCHGVFTAREGPRVFLQAEDGTVAAVKGQDLADRLAELPQQPRLIVLASCESAGTAVSKGEPGSDALHSLAPLLAQAGVPAILAMRGKISMETVKVALPVFFRELVLDGQADRAIGVARAAAVIAGRPDFWMMALFLRLRGGRIWYEPGFGGEDFDKWQSIVNHVRNGKFVAIIGSGVAESFFGDSRSQAQKLAQTKGFPLASDQQDDLPQVLQYMDLKWDRSTVIAAMRRQLREEVLWRRRSALPDALTKESLAKILDYLIDQKAASGSKNAYQILAGLPGSVYVSTMPDRLMARALKLAGKEPQVLYAKWRKTETNIPAEPAFNAKETPATPVVYQMLGVFGKDEYAPENESLVLTENDYFDYMIATARYGLVPRVVRSAMVENSLLFLGFQLTDWSFRVLFRLIQSLEGGGKSENMNMSHVGVQVNPDEYSLADVKEARKHLERYFNRARVAVFWGSAEDFLAQLQHKIDTAPEIAMAASATDQDEF